MPSTQLALYVGPPGSLVPLLRDPSTEAPQPFGLRWLYLISSASPLLDERCTPSLS